LTDDDVQPAEAAIEVLENVGLVCQNDELLQALAGVGCEVDAHGERARFPKAVVTDFLDQLRRNRAGKIPPRDEGFPKLDPPALTMQVAQFYYDTAAGEKRQGNTEDFIELVKLGEVLHGEDGVGHALTLTDINPLLEPLEVGMLLAEHASRPQQPFASDIRQMDYLLEMGEIVGIGNWFSFGAFTFAHPLRFDRDTAARFARRIQASAENIALGDIIETSLGGPGHLLSAHTATRFRDSLYLPGLLDRAGHAGAESDDALLARAVEQKRELLTAYTRPDIDPDTLQQMRRIAERAERDLCS